METLENKTEEIAIKNTDSNKRHVKTGYWICGLVSDLILLGAVTGWVILTRNGHEPTGNTLVQYSFYCSLALLSILNNIEPYREISRSSYNQ